MKIKVTDVVLDYDGTPMLDGEDPLTLRTAFRVALNSFLPNEEMGAEKKTKLYALTLKIFTGKEVEITTDEAALIKERGALFLTPLVYGRIVDLFENRP